MARAGGWEFFLTRWGLLYEAVAGTVKSAAQTQPQLSQAQVCCSGSVLRLCATVRRWWWLLNRMANATVCQAAKLDVLIKKALRAKEVLQQLQDSEQRHVQLRARFAPLVAQLPELQATLLQGDKQPPGSRQPALTVDEGEYVQTLRGNAWLPAPQPLDPYGISIAMASSTSLALMTWRDFASGIRRASAAAEALLGGPNMAELVRFSLERRTLVREMRSMAAQLQQDVELPSLTPLDQECDALDSLLATLRHVQDAHLHMVQQELSSLNLPLLELKLHMREGQAWQGSAAHAAIRQLQLLLAAIKQGRVLPLEAWEELEQDLQTVEQAVAARQEGESERATAINEQRHQQQLYARLSRLKGAEGDQAAVAGCS